MQRIKLVFAAACAVAAGSARLSAQQFDGIIQFVNYDHVDGERVDTVTQYTKGSKVRFDGMGEHHGSMIFNGTSSIIIMPERKRYMELPPNFGKQVAKNVPTKHGVATKTGKSENVAGITCEDWHYKGTDDEGKVEEGDACIAKGAGMQVNRITNGLAGEFFSEGGPEFAEAMKTGGIMKATRNGKLSFVAVKAQATSVPDAMFAPPAGYTKMSMPGMGGPPE